MKYCKLEGRPTCKNYIHKWIKNKNVTSVDMGTELGIKQQTRSRPQLDSKQTQQTAGLVPGKDLGRVLTAPYA
jgi:hypothetical protein